VLPSPSEPSEISEIWRRLDLPTPYFAEAVVAGMKAARDPANTPLSHAHITIIPIGATALRASSVWLGVCRSVRCVRRDAYH
jgi:hypothetical protein